MKSWITSTTLAVLAVGGAIAIVSAVGARRWERAAELRRRQIFALAQSHDVVFRCAMLDELPAPVRRYFSAVLHEGRRLPSAARLLQDGEMRMDEREDRWRPFTASASVVSVGTRRVAFRRRSRMSGCNCRQRVPFFDARAPARLPDDRFTSTYT